jgi:hypothetical protein
MPAESSKLIAKKKSVVNKESYFKAPRRADDPAHLNASLYQDVGDLRLFNAGVVDKVRVVLGKNWDFRKKVSAAAANKVFSNNWERPKIFGSSGNIQYALSPPEICVLECPENGCEIDNFKIVLTTPNIPESLENDLIDWLAYMKTGLKASSDISFPPVVKTNTIFYDYYHQSSVPFGPDEMANKQPGGKTFFANFKTYYNERINSADFELITGQDPGIQNSLPSIYSFLSLATNKSLVENGTLDLESLLADENGPIRYFYHPKAAGPGIMYGHMHPGLYKQLLKHYPLETSLSLYGSIVKIIEKIITLNFDKFDASSLFSQYYNEYTTLISEDIQLTLTPPDIDPRDDEGKVISWDNNQPAAYHAWNKIRALERITTNLVFSPDMIKLLNKADKYKKHFPFYTELEFTADLFAPLGDLMKQLFLAKPISEAILSNFRISNSDPPPGSTQRLRRGGARVGQGVHVGDLYEDSWTTRPEYSGRNEYVEYAEEKIYKSINSADPNSVVELTEGAVSDFVGKKHQNLLEIIYTWTNGKKKVDGEEDLPLDFCDDTCEGVYIGEQVMPGHSGVTGGAGGTFSTKDLRNYITHFKSDSSGPIEIDSDENIFFKKLFGSAFYAKLLTLYNEHKRSWEEILDGKLAHTEDLFYRIEKSRKDNVENAEWKKVQNILIPNTSELDVVKYIDTQLKYSDYATYKYDVYVHRVVFGSKYFYQWLDQNDNTVMLDHSANKTINELKDDYSNNLSPIDGLSRRPVNENGDVSTSYTAQFRATVEPSIIILQDKLFSTSDIVIIDKPPVVPDVNIIPYRAINSRIKILLTGASDRYRAKPILILPGDEEKFEKIKAAQLSFDEKIEFGSDDPVKRFQIFRIQQKPKSYSDFKIYTEINEEFYEETIFPNTKYYYTFRAIDSHGHISNPTQVYEVELIDEKGAVKPVIRLVDMEPQENKINIKDCQKYIYLKPALKQIYFSDSSEVDGIFSSSEKRKKYKMRLTSKGSGKKIDINFSFKKEIQNKID